MKKTHDGQVVAHPGRRGFLKLSGALTACGMLGVGTLSSVAKAAALTKSQRDAMTPEQILAMMKKGNERFRKGLRSDTRSFLAQQKASAKGQYPAAVLLSCIDSRAPAETIMDLGIGDIFNCRVAGNVSNDDILLDDFGNAKLAQGFCGSLDCGSGRLLPRANVLGPRR